MKNKILLILISFFIFCPNCLALSKINSMTIKVSIDEAGNANVVEEWQINDGNNYYEKEFINSQNFKINNINIVDSNETVYQNEEKYNSKSKMSYNYQDKKDTKLIRINTSGRETSLKLSYGVEGMIKTFKDAEGLDWQFINSLDREIGILNVYINGPVSFNENNTAIYAIGNNLSGEINNGQIHLFSSNVDSNNSVRLLTTFTDINFTNTIKIEDEFSNYLNNISKESKINYKIKNLFNNIIVKIIMVIILIVIFVLLIFNSLKKKRKNRDYKNIVTYNKERNLGYLNSVDYNDEIPCDGDIYKIYFYANYYNIIKHRSTLIGALLFKWIIEGIIKIENKDDKYILHLSETKVFARELDNRLYTILKNASSNLILEGNKLLRYCESENQEIINWYTDVVNESLIDEYTKHNISIKGKKIHLNKMIESDAKKILGLKRYLLNFNQVPRKTELTESVYTSSLILSVLLGVDENLYQEILRKNESNELASLLKDFSKVKYLYYNLYSSTYDAYQKNKNKKKIDYKINTQN